jgi:hypothetical protein
LRILCVGFLLAVCFSTFAGDDFHAGPLFDSFPLTLDSGSRAEAAGPFFYDEKRETERTWAIPPFFSHEEDPAVEAREDDFLYPLLTCERYGAEYRWQLFQLFSFAGGANPDESKNKRFTIFPIYFQQRSTDPDENYTAVLPFYGHLKNRLFRDEISFVMLPFFVESRKHDVVTENYFYPFFDLRHGDGLHGWQLWPLVGEEHKVVTTSTNGFGDVTVIGGHDYFFALWPFYFNHTDGIGTDDPQKFWGVFPLYTQLRSPQRDATTALWPFFNWIDDREKKYREWEVPWPVVVIARGEGKTITRVFPLFSQGHNDTYESDFYAWPVYKFNRIHTETFEQRRTRILFYLFQNVHEENKELNEHKERINLWPFFIYYREFNGNSRLQIIAPVEGILPNNRGVERNWSPLWSLWRSQDDPKTGAKSRSLLWNLYRCDETPGSKNCSLCFGLFQYHCDGENKKIRLFYVFTTHGGTK